MTARSLFTFFACAALFSLFPSVGLSTPPSAPILHADCNLDGTPDLIEVRSMVGGDSNLSIAVVSGSDGAVLKTFAAPLIDSFFGYAALFVPDSDGDGLPDVAISAPGVARSASTGPYGRVYVFSSCTGQLLKDWSGEHNEAFGLDMRLIPDWDDDGAHDLEVLGMAFSGNTLVGRSRVVSVVSGQTLCDDAFETVPQSIAANEDYWKRSDVDKNGVLALLDVQIVVLAAGNDACFGDVKDVNGDKVIDGQDLIIILDEFYNQASPVVAIRPAARIVTSERAAFWKRWLFDAPTETDHDGGAPLRMPAWYPRGAKWQGTSLSLSVLDSDADGIPDADEVRLGLHPGRPDSDGDGLKDGVEMSLGSDARSADTDGDGLNDGLEKAMGLLARRRDTDGDGIDDKLELDRGTNAKGEYTVTVYTATTPNGNTSTPTPPPPPPPPPPPACTTPYPDWLFHNRRCAEGVFSQPAIDWCPADTCGVRFVGARPQWIILTEEEEFATINLNVGRFGFSGDYEFAIWSWPNRFGDDRARTSNSARFELYPGQHAITVWPKQHVYGALQQGDCYPSGDSIVVNVVKLDMDVDSDNGPYDRRFDANSPGVSNPGHTLAEGAGEEFGGGKAVLVRNHDADGDGIPESADGFDRPQITQSSLFTGNPWQLTSTSNRRMVPVRVRTDSLLWGWWGWGGQNAGKTKLEYPLSEPGSTLTPAGDDFFPLAPGKLRMWGYRPWWWGGLEDGPIQHHPHYSSDTTWVRNHNGEFGHWTPGWGYTDGSLMPAAEHPEDYSWFWDYRWTTHSVLRYNSLSEQPSEFVDYAPAPFSEHFPDSEWMVMWAEAVRPSTSTGDVDLRLEVILQDVEIDGVRKVLSICDKVKMTAVEVKYFSEVPQSAGGTQWVETNSLLLAPPSETVELPGGGAQDLFSRWTTRGRVAIKDVRTRPDSVNLFGRNVPLGDGPNGYAATPPLYLSGHPSPSIDVPGAFLLTHDPNGPWELWFNPIWGDPPAIKGLPTDDFTTMVRQDIQEIATRLKDQPFVLVNGRNLQQWQHDFLARTGQAALDHGSFGKQMTWELEQRYAGRADILVSVRVNATSGKVFRIGDAPGGNIAGTVEADLLHVENGYRPNVDDVWDPTKVKGSIEVKSSFAAELPSGQIERIDAVFCGNRPGVKTIVTRSSEKWRLATNTWTSKTRGSVLIKSLAVLGVLDVAAAGVTVVLCRQDLADSFEADVVPFMRRVASTNVEHPEYAAAQSDLHGALRTWLSNRIGLSGLVTDIGIWLAWLRAVGRDEGMRQSIVEPID